MRLIDLSPRWIHESIFTFLCPHCQTTWLTCKLIAMDHTTQRLILDEAFGEDQSHLVVGCQDDHAWTATNRDFESMSVTPSLDASASGHWHGFITAGQIV